MRTIEEITKDLSENNGMLLIQSVLTKEDKIRCLLKKIDLGNELIAAQDAEIARLRDHFTWKLTKSEPDDETMVYLTFCVAGKPYYFPLPPPPELKEEEENDHAND